MKNCATRLLILLILVPLPVLQSCRKSAAGTGQSLPIEKAILHEKTNFYSTDFSAYTQDTRELPIGVFDSGTGGLTVLDALLTFDQYINTTGTPGADGVPDFLSEKFVYLADQANMPYGNYYSANKSELLVEHIIKDAQFLLGNKYYQDQQSAHWQSDKQGAKIIVVACNTATAYGKEHIESFVKKTGTGVHVIGVIDAGARGALEVFRKDENGSIGVLATVGTIASNGYEKTLRKMITDNHYSGNIMIFNQGGYGIAEAVDEVAGFIDHRATRPYKNYLGPSRDGTTYTIDDALLDNYNFDKERLLCDSRDTDDCRIMQLNSAENYVRFHVVSLLEQMRNTPDVQPLKALLLGCTHYPFLSREIRIVLNELYNFRRDGEYVYRDIMAPEIQLIDPAVNVARELHTHLNNKDLFSRNNTMMDSEFYISVPNISNPRVQVDSSGQFTYAYKYGRTDGEIQEYVKMVPFSRQNISDETLDRLREMIPTTYDLVAGFNQYNNKTAFLRDSVRSSAARIIR